MASVTLKNVCKAYGDVLISKNVDLTINEGEFVVFVGPSGCGKSTLLRCIAGLEDITSGDLYIGDQRMNDVEPSKRGVGMVFQSYALYPHLNLYDNMSFGLKLAKADKAEIDKRVEQAAEILQLGHLLERQPKALSGGQRQRVAIGRAIVREPTAFLFDEPLSNLDAALRVNMRVEIMQMHKDMKATMIYVTHDQIEAMTLADRIVVNSRWSLEALVKQGVQESKLNIIPLCFEPPTDTPHAALRTPNPTAPLRVLFLGQVILRKGIQYLMQSAKMLEGENIRFDVVGPAGITPEAMRSAPKNMFFHGRSTRDQTVDWYRQSDVFVLPTLSDGFALTQLEAMAHGLPVVTTRRAGAADLVAHFEKRTEAMDGKAMVVCMSRRICVDLYEALIKLRPDWASAKDDDAEAEKGKACVVKVIMTGSADDGPEWQPHIRNKEKRRAMATRISVASAWAKVLPMH